MALTSPDNIYSPNIDDNWAVPQAMGALADSVQEALKQRANFYTGTASERGSFRPEIPGTHWQDTDQDQFEWVWRGARWQAISRVTSGVISMSPTANQVSSVSVPFPSGFFTQTPEVTIVADTTVPGVVQEVSFTDATKAGFTARMYRSSSATTSLNWVAVQTPKES